MEGSILSVNPEKTQDFGVHPPGLVWVHPQQSYVTAQHEWL